MKSISATGDRVLTGKIDAAKAWIEFENGCKALVAASRLAPEKVRRLQVHQKGSYISIDYQTQEVRRHYKKGTDVAFDIIRPEPREPLKEELKDFLSCVRGRRKPRVSGVEAMEALNLVPLITDRLKQSR